MLNREELSTSTIAAGASSIAIGGLAGRSTGPIAASWAAASVSADAKSSAAGGLVGAQRLRGVVADSFARSNVKAGVASNGIGGIAGSTTRPRILRSCSSSVVAGGTGSVGVGGLVGSQTGASAASSYWNVGVSGQAMSALGSGRTTSQVRRRNTYLGWDFVKVWVPPTPNRYPLLR